MQSTVLDLAGNGSWRVEMREGIPFLLWERINGFYACQFGSWKLRKTLFGLDHLFFNNFDLFIVISFH